MLASWTRDGDLDRVLRRIRQGEDVALYPIAEGAAPFLLVWLAAAVGRPVIAVTDSRRAQDELVDDVEGYGDLLLGGGLPAATFPEWDPAALEGGTPELDSVVDRLTALSVLGRGPEAKVIVTSIAALLQKTFSPEALARFGGELRPGMRIERDELLGRLVDLEYSHEHQVNAPGEFAVRGGIVDLFSPSENAPVRLEFFGDEIETMRRFDPATQRTTGAAASVHLAPAGELAMLRRDPSMAGPVWEHFPSESLLVWVNPDRVLEQVERFERPAGDDAAALFVSWPEALEALESRPLGSRISLLEHGAAARIGAAAESVELEMLPLTAQIPDLHPEERGAVLDTARRLLFEQLSRWGRQGYRIAVCCNNEGERQRFREILEELHLDTPAVEDHLARISRGFVYPAGRLAVVTDAEIFGRYRTRRPRRMRVKVRAQDIAPIGGLDEVAPGDYVVHVQHGIGRYLGLRELEFDGRRQEVLAVEYAEGARLYVPVEQFHLLSRYVGAGRRPPHLHKLGDSRWNRSRRAAERAVADLAADLLRIQAIREARRGHAFSPDTAWQREFEAAFPYEETEDQARAVADVKADMESPRPMDRLICGDVGYGKTEVAMRAAFKAVMDGKQVAVLVPTTVLAQQHFETFRERMADYPVRVEMLSRFRSRREQKEVLEDLARGVVDIVIGTHRLLQRDVAFHDLGLVVIDEEQRFGVLDKERFKRMREMVDVLTLTATPIPRTLYLAMSNARDMSTIQTPPHDRLPIVTRVAQYSDELVRTAILDEVRRGGQVYYLHNRVRTIDAVADRLRTLLPDVGIEVAHGQMREDDLEEVMSRFVAGKFEVLVCTTIIESGLDIPNVNTMIIDRADRFGLSELYQLRGRVGRYRVQAHAWLLLPRHGVLLDTARKRIGAIRQYTSLGSGFRIAMRDLEIRGAGNILGREQSGHIAAVGFDLYCRLLREAVSRMKGEPVAPRPEAALRFDFLSVGSTVPIDGRAEARIPSSYIAEETLRIEAYRRVAVLAEEEAIGDLHAEFEDRFGPPPPPVLRLLECARIRILAVRAGFDRVETEGSKILLSRRGHLFQVGTRFPRMRGETPEERLQEIVSLLRSIADVRKDRGKQDPRRAVRPRPARSETA